MIRPFELRDIARIREIHDRSGIDRVLPDFTAPDAVSLFVFVDENDDAVALAGSRMTAEVYYIADPSWATPGQRHAALRGLYAAVDDDLYDKGICQVIAWINPEVRRAFSRRLESTWGWVKSNSPIWIARTHS